MAKKLRLGWFTLTCSEDNTIVFVELLNEYYFEWKKKIDFIYCKALKSENAISQLDVAFVEGAVAGKKEEELLKEIRKNSRYLIAVGACACTGMPSGHRNLFSQKLKEQIRPFLKEHGLYDNVQPVKDVVRADEMIPGCPIEPDKFVSILNNCFIKFGVD